MPVLIARPGDFRGASTALDVLADHAFARDVEPWRPSSGRTEDPGFTSSAAEGVHSTRPSSSFAPRPPSGPRPTAVPSLTRASAPVGAVPSDREPSPGTAGSPEPAVDDAGWGFTVRPSVCPSSCALCSCYWDSQCDPPLGPSSCSSCSCCSMPDISYIRLMNSDLRRVRIE